MSSLLRHHATQGSLQNKISPEKIAGVHARAPTPADLSFEFKKL
jgi:hypothetical protein